MTLSVVKPKLRLVGNPVFKTYIRWINVYPPLMMDPRSPEEHMFSTGGVCYRSKEEAKQNAKSHVLDIVQITITIEDRG